MQDWLNKLREELHLQVDEKTIESTQYFFKESINCYGVKIPTVNKISKNLYKEIKHLPKSTQYEMCEELWQSGVLEESFVACNWVYALREKFEPTDFTVFSRWIEDYVRNWASCDTFCNHTLGDFVEMYPQFLSELKKMCLSHNRWVRRAAAVTLVVSARKGKFLSEIFEIARLLLEDTDDLVRKGYGWLLKAASEAHCDEVFAFVMANKMRMPRTALRYAIEKMPPEMKAQAMAKE